MKKYMAPDFEEIKYTTEDIILSTGETDPEQDNGSQEATSLL